MTDGPAKKLHKNKFFKIGLFLLVILMPVLLVMMVFMPLVSRKNNDQLIEKYRLPASFTLNDVRNVVEMMRKEQEFAFYFYALSASDVQVLAEDAYNVLNANRSPESLLRKIREIHESARSKGLVFYDIEYPEDFALNPEEHPDLNTVLWAFLSEEFKLTILGICYKATYDSRFSFDWDQTSQKAAEKLYRLIMQLKNNEKPG